MASSASAWKTVGQQAAVGLFTRAAAERRLAHAYLLVGPRHVGKMTLALDLSRLVNCTAPYPPCGGCDQCLRIERGVHADDKVMTVERGADDERGRVFIGIDQVREAQHDASLRPYEGRTRVFIVDGADTLSDAAGNSLLKVLEEPPDDVLFLLLAVDVDSVVPTVASRCQTVNLRPLPVALIAEELRRLGCEADEAERLARLSRGRLGWAIAAMERTDLVDESAARLGTIATVVAAGIEERLEYSAKLASRFAQNRTRVVEEVGLWLRWWRDVLLVKEGVAELLDDPARAPDLSPFAESLSFDQIAAALSSARDATEHLDRNANPRLALDDMMLRLPAIVHG